jgi:hypothetical protein
MLHVDVQYHCTKILYFWSLLKKHHYHVMIEEEFPFGLNSMIKFVRVMENICVQISNQHIRFEVNSFYVKT